MTLITKTTAIIAGLAVAMGGWLFVSENGPFRPQDEREKMWQDVQEAMNQGLPKTAIEVLDRLRESAVEDADWDDAVRATVQRIQLDVSINDPNTGKAVKALQAALGEANDEMKPMMEVILAEWYFGYYNQNRWRFAQRSQTAEPPGEDIETWDLARLLDAVDTHFTIALDKAETLKTIPVEDWEDILVEGNVSDAHRPTLYDFIAHEALRFYAYDEQFIRQQGSFTISGDSPIFGDTDAFLAWNPETGDEDSYLLRAVRLYQDLLRFHQEDDDRTAFLDADLARIQFAGAVATGSEVKARYRAALQRFADAHSDHELSSLALGYLGRSYQGDTEYLKALEAARVGKNRFEDSVGGRMCHNVITAALMPEVQSTTEQVWNDAGPEINLHYRNVEHVWFRLYPFDFVNWKEWGSHGDYVNSMNNDEWQQLLKRKPAAAWSTPLPRTEDHKTRTKRIPVDVSQLDLASGSYILIASHNEAFTGEANQVAYSGIQVSPFAVVMRQRSGSGMLEGMVYDAVTGLPVPGADADAKAKADPNVQIWSWTYDGRNSRERNESATTILGDGYFGFKAKPSTHHKIVITIDGQQFGLVDNNYIRERGRPRSIDESVVFFTDRRIYRPGQSIQFKGIAISSARESNEYTTLPGRSINVSLHDVNNEVVETLELRTNDFGSVSGTFTAPRDRATGQMYLRVSSGPSGQAYVRVEEYKRPKFQVTVDAPTDAPGLGDTVTVTGSAIQYSGAAVDGAKVTWRVVRNVSWPQWYRYRYWYAPMNSESTEIANGEMETDSEGSFTVSFDALPDPSIEREKDPTFSYTVYVDVTDTAGETRSSQVRVSAGYTSLESNVTVSDWQTTGKPVSASVRVTNLNGQGQEVAGKVIAYSLTPPERVQRESLNDPYGYLQSTPDPDDQSRMASIDYWPNGEVAFEQELSTDDEGNASVDFTPGSGAYRLVFETADPKGNPVRAEKAFLVVDLHAKQFPVKIPNYLEAEQWTVEPGGQFNAIWGTGYESGRALVQVEHRGQLRSLGWTPVGNTQTLIQIPIKESYRGGLQLRITFIKENRAYLMSRRIDVPWSNKELSVTWEHFVSKLQPGAKETWTAVVKGPDAETVAAEFVAAMYDASLDAFAPNSWRNGFNVFYNDYSSTSLTFRNDSEYFRNLYSNWGYDYRHEGRTYRHLIPDLAEMQAMEYLRRARSRGQLGMGGGGGNNEPAGRAFDTMSEAGEMADSAMALPSAATAAPMEKGLQQGFLGFSEDAVLLQRGDSILKEGVDLEKVSARTNLNETAFFYPNLISGEDGTVRIEFEIPEALTEWKFLGFAHDNELRSALLTGETVTSKDLMAQPNPPRFLREGDSLQFSTRVINQSDQVQSGRAKLSLTDARTGQSLDGQFLSGELEQAFEIPAGQSTSLFWQIDVPDFVGAIQYRVVAATEKLSDGEEGALPVLSRRILVRESLPLPIRGNTSRDFEFQSLLNAGDSDTLESQNLTVQMVSNPSWYAVMSLPYLMEFPHECSEQTFNRFYANALGRHIVTSDRRIEQVFDQWRNTEALDSPLEKNEDLRNILLAESPWLDDARDESQARRRVGLLFDKNRLDLELKQAFDRLSQMQYSDGAWPWFPGGPANDYLTLYITTGFGRLRNLGLDVDMQPAFKSLDRLDNWLKERYDDIVRRGRLNDNNLSSLICLYLYGRSFFIEEKPVADQYRTAFDYFVGQAKEYWVDLGNRQSQGHAAIALHRLKDKETPAAIVASLIERSISDDEMGMFWREGQASWWWYQAPVETQALMIELFDEVAGDAERVEELKIWLLKQKQVQNWKTTKATADACYALLLRGANLLASSQLVKVELGGTAIEPTDVEAGTGFYEQRFVRSEVEPSMGEITVTKSDDGIAWGSVHWQYLEDVGKIKPYEGTPLTIRKALYVKRNTDQGPVIEEIKGPVEVGDEVVMRVELRVDREMEYVHLKDYRGSGTEPVNVLSRYKSQDGLWYYESTRDTATHFFIDYMPRGTYVFEYSVRVQHRGKYQTGIAELQCMYAPEFNSHSNSVELVVE